jgi:flavin reductase (DIM6/NTAB) family NADH-FMN oxidoreductase RutF
MNELDPQRQLAAALGRIPSGLFIVTSSHQGQETGMLASWVQQCAFDPPHLSLALKRGRPLHKWLTEGAAFVVNVLDDTQTDMVAHFGRGFSPEQPAFEGLEVERSGERPPVLKDALAYLECRMVGHLMVGDHDVFLGQIVGGRVLNEGHPMVHVRKSGLHY